MFWNLNYWDSVSTIAAEVEHPSETLPKALGFAVMLVVVTYVAPLIVALGTDSSHHTDYSKWRDGYLAEMAGRIGGEWLEGWVLLAAASSNMGLFGAEMS